MESRADDAVEVWFSVLSARPLSPLARPDNSLRGEVGVKKCSLTQT